MTSTLGNPHPQPHPTPTTGHPQPDALSAPNPPPPLLTLTPTALLTLTRTAGPDAALLLVTMASLTPTGSSHLTARQSDIVDALAGDHRGWNTKKVAAQSRRLHDLGYVIYLPGRGRGSHAASRSTWHLTCPNLFPHLSGANTTTHPHLHPADSCDMGGQTPAPLPGKSDTPDNSPVAAARASSDPTNPDRHVSPTSSPEPHFVTTTNSRVYDLHAFRNRHKPTYIDTYPPVEDTNPPPAAVNTAHQPTHTTPTMEGTEFPEGTHCPPKIRAALVAEMRTLDWWHADRFLATANWHLLCALMDYRRTRPNLNGGWVRTQHNNRRPPPDYTPHAPVILTPDGYVTLTPGPHPPTFTSTSTPPSAAHPTTPTEDTTPNDAPPNAAARTTHLPTTAALLAAIAALGEPTASELRATITARAHATLPPHATSAEQGATWRRTAHTVLTEHQRQHPHLPPT